MNCTHQSTQSLHVYKQLSITAYALINCIALLSSVTIVGTLGQTLIEECERIKLLEYLH